MSAANEQRAFAESGLEIVRDSSGEMTDNRFESSRRLFDRPNLSGSYSKEATSGSVFNLVGEINGYYSCLLYTSPSPRDGLLSRMPSSA